MPLTGGLYWEEHGDGLPVILSSGLGGSADYWKPNIAELARHNRVITYDHRGTGRSDRDVAGTLTVATLADDILFLMDQLGLASARIVGHAAGGLAGLHIALHAPERVERLCVINGWARLSPHTGRCFDARLALLRDTGVRAFAKAQPIFLYPPQWNVDNQDRLILEEEAQVAHFPGNEMVQRRIAAVRVFNIEQRLAEISTPTLFVVAEDDVLVPPSCSYAMVKGVKGAQLARFATGGHACNVTRPDAFNQWLQAWLAP